MMEGVTARVYRGMKGYWQRRGYQRLGGGATRKTKESGGKQQRMRFWRIRMTPRPKLRCSPKKFFIRLRDAYVSMMMRLANTSVVHGRAIGGYGGTGIDGFGVRPMKEYDEKMILRSISRWR